MNLSEIPVRLKAMRRSQADLARHLDLDPSSLTKTLKGERRVQPAEVVKIERYFGEKLEVAVAGQAPAPTRRRPVNARVPVYGYASEAYPEEGRVVFGEDRIVASVEPPPWWSGEGHLVYLRMIGERMHPRYFAGELVPVLLDLKPGRGQDCMIEFTDGSAIVRTYHGERDGQVWVEQYGDDPRTYGIRSTEVKVLHAVWKPGMV